MHPTLWKLNPCRWEEHERRIHQRLCLYCGQPGHMRASCPTHPSRRVSPTVSSTPSSSSIEIPAELLYNDETIQTLAMIDSGAAGNFMDLSFAKAQNITLIPCNSVLSVAALDGCPLGTGQVTFISDDVTLQVGSLHKEILRSFIIESPQKPIILGLPWLRQHNPQISWVDNTAIKPASSLHHAHTRLNTHLPTTHIPMNIQTSLKPSAKPKPPYCHFITPAIVPLTSSPARHHLIPGSTPPGSTPLPLSQPESEAMQHYIEEELAKGFIQPSTSPASAGFFFVKTKMGA